MYRSAPFCADVDCANPAFSIATAWIIQKIAKCAELAGPHIILKALFGSLAGRIPYTVIASWHEILSGA